MTGRSAWAAALIFAALAGPALVGSAVAAAGDATTTGATVAAIAPTFGRTLPPVGFVRFCERMPEACKARSLTTGRPHLSARQWDTVYRINAFVNAEVTPASDADLYGEAEYWAYPKGAGDCEDYALLKQRYLEALGFPRSALLLTVVLDDKGEGHAVLTLAASEGDFILDNRRDPIRRWAETDYTFLKRQSARDPQDWLSLTGREPSAPGTVAAQSTR